MASREYGSMHFSYLLQRNISYHLVYPDSLRQAALYKPVLCHPVKTLNLLTYLLTPGSRILLEKLTGSQLVKKFTSFYGTQRFITAFTTAHHPSLSWARLIQSITPHPTSWRSILIIFILSPCMLLHSVLLPTLCTYLIKNYHNSHLKPHTLKMSVMHN